MTSLLPTLQAEDNDISRPDTPLASHHAPPNTLPPPVFPPNVHAPLASAASHSGQSPDASYPPSNYLLLPIPKPSTNRSRSSFSFSDVVDTAGGLDSLSPEIGSADISIARGFRYILNLSCFTEYQHIQPMVVLWRLLLALPRVN